MRNVRLESPFYIVADDPNGVIGAFLGFAVSLRNLSGRPPLEEFADIFGPDGKGMRLPDTFAAYRAREPDELPEEFVGSHGAEVRDREIWVLTLLRYGKIPESALVEGDELRHLLQEAWAERTRYSRQHSGS